MSDKLAIVFDGPPSHEAGRFVEVELNGASVSFGEWQENGDYWELVLPDPYAERAQLEQRIEELEGALELNMKWIGPPHTDKYSYDSLREDAWAKGRRALSQQEEA